MRQYKAQCVLRYDQIVATAATGEMLAREFADGLVATLRDDASMHRLWYDLRSQALFEESFRADVLEIDATLERMIWRIVTRYAELVAHPPTTPSAMTYALFDGLFQQALLRHLAGSTTAASELRSHARQLLEQVVPSPVTTPWTGRSNTRR